MNYGTRTFLLFMLLLLSVVANAQTLEVPNIEYPNDPCELRNENNVFVHAPLSVRQRIVKELREHSNLFIVERPEEADFLLLFTYTPFAEGSADDSPPDVNGMTPARAELTAVKFVTRSEDQVRPRILFYWSAQKSFHSIPLPLSGLSPNGFAMPRSGKSAAGELIARFLIWAVHKSWPRTLYFDPFSNQLTISMDGKLEVKGIKAFIKELKNARSDAYVLRCTPQPTVAPVESAAPAIPLPSIVFPDTPSAVERPPAEWPQGSLLIQNRPVPNEGRPRSVKRSKKAGKGH